jgi:tetratricopeptide (TPR) repeat protein
MSRVPRLRAECEIKSLPLTPADGFLLSRVDATADEHELTLVTGFTTEQVVAMLDRLAGLGAIEFVGGSVGRPRLRSVPDIDRDRPAHNAPTPPAPIAGEPAEREDDPEERRMRRVALAHKLSGTYARVTPAVRPDTYEADPANAERIAEALRARQEQATAAARAAQLAQSLEQGRCALAREDFAGAMDAYRLAASLAPDDRGVQATCQDAIRRAARALADVCWERAVHEEREALWEDAARSYAGVCAGRPGDALAHERAANAALRSGNPRRAVEFARRAIELEPGSAMFRITLARTYGAAGLEKSFHGELDRALEVAPNDARVANLVSRVRSLSLKTGRAS